MGDWDPLGVGMMFYLMIISFYISVPIIVFFNSIGTELPIDLIGILIGSITFIGSFFSTEKLYSKLDEKYREESNKKLKGWLVFIFVIGGFLSLFISFFVSI